MNDELASEILRDAQQRVGEERRIRDTQQHEAEEHAHRAGQERERLLERRALALELLVSTLEERGHPTLPIFRFEDREIRYEPTWLERHRHRWSRGTRTRYESKYIDTKTCGWLIRQWSPRAFEEMGYYPTWAGFVVDVSGALQVDHPLHISEHSNSLYWRGLPAASLILLGHWKGDILRMSAPVESALQRAIDPRPLTIPGVVDIGTKGDGRPV